MDVESTDERTLAEITEESMCPHHWIIDSPAGPSSRGVCRLCGEERDFQNYPDHSYGHEELTWDRLLTLNQRTATTVISSDGGQEEDS